ncbi:GIY-YIG nuclease family protein [Croceimicrobium hydrocarbonivorans]|uniref:GIY-YIG nuclease family protein n=1 Tax=Croceimicrobium hydrocarbonivorans TaxID=2761580 RepID=A0A7H0VG82_9FLAO|nr:GIY-YIG nuclease family protein [Croceimicrobium hydrocarbonivorans]QNR24730.1 GIY-YIG nuclease family protein [Croceimicrobium hydrocarbonivorans]
MEGFYTYMIYSEKSDIMYKGYSQNVELRLRAHNEGRSRYTRNKGPWVLVYLRKFASKEEALRHEKYLKVQNRPYLKWLVKTPQNELL